MISKELGTCSQCEAQRRNLRKETLHLVLFIVSPQSICKTKAHDTLLHAPLAKIGNRRRVDRDCLSAVLVELGGSQNNLGSIDGRGKDTEFGLLSSHVKAGYTGTDWGSRSRGIVSHSPLGDNERGSHLGACRSEGVGRRQDEGEE